MFDFVLQTIFEVATRSAIFAFVVFFVWVTYHLLVDEDDPIKLRLESESFDREWKDLCSKLQ